MRGRCVARKKMPQGGVSTPIRKRRKEVCLKGRKLKGAREVSREHNVRRYVMQKII